MGKRTTEFRGDRMQALRQAGGLSRAQLALLAQVSPETVRNAETGACHPSARVARALAVALGVPIADLSPPGEAITLKVLRRRTGLTQKQVAERVGVSPGMVSKVEAGMYGVRALARWAAAYGVSARAWAAAWKAGRERRREEAERKRGERT
ncbi:helix-turn-helix transcriptional regulator [Kitasatospora sp. NPDC048538]|uniref:helix-turn-helix transcriptional regulator n=1 Tax=Kitasatospora sp. NPDC048538 TaxID=3155633 RepID=UPI0033E11937